MQLLASAGVMCLGVQATSDATGSTERGYLAVRSPFSLGETGLYGLYLKFFNYKKLKPQQTHNKEFWVINWQINIHEIKVKICRSSRSWLCVSKQKRRPDLAVAPGCSALLSAAAHDLRACYALEK